jgi:hypothetical protein
LGRERWRYAIRRERRLAENKSAPFSFFSTAQKS